MNQLTRAIREQAVRLLNENVVDVVIGFQAGTLALKTQLEESLKDLGYRNTVSRDIYNLEEEFIVVHGFPSESYAMGYVELLKNNRDYRINRENFVILSSNYKVVQVHKNLEEYRTQLQTPKP